MQLLRVAPPHLKNVPPPPHRPIWASPFSRLRCVYPARGALRRTSTSDQFGQPLERARALSESITLLETVAADREARVEEILDCLSSPGMT